MTNKIIYEALGEELQELEEYHLKIDAVTKDLEPRMIFAITLTMAAELHILKYGNKEDFLDYCENVYEARLEQIRNYISGKKD